jgi:hypothetical protein
MDVGWYRVLSGGIESKPSDMLDKKSKHPDILYTLGTYPGDHSAPTRHHPAAILFFVICVLHFFISITLISKRGAIFAKHVS